MAHSGSNKKVANSLVALSSAAVLAVYSAGYIRTRSAADRYVHAATRRPAVPAPPSTAPPIENLRREAPSATPDLKHKAAAAPVLTASAKPAAATPIASAPAAPPPAEMPAPPPAPTVAAPPVDPAPPVPEPKVEVAAVAPPAPPAIVWKDGTYLGWGSCRHGDIQASVVIAGGRIASATIAQCLTRYSCSVIEALPPQVAQRQSAEVDWVSGATQSADAFSYAVSDALSKAK